MLQSILGDLSAETMVANIAQGDKRAMKIEEDGFIFHTVLLLRL